MRNTRLISSINLQSITAASLAVMGERISVCVGGANIDASLGSVFSKVSRAFVSSHTGSCQIISELFIRAISRNNALLIRIINVKIMGTMRDTKSKIFVCVQRTSIYTFPQIIGGPCAAGTVDILNTYHAGFICVESGASY